MLYHFPSDPIALTNLRTNALDELRWRMRVPVIRQFGSASVEFFAAVVRCESCNAVSAAVRGLSPSTFDTSWSQLIDYFSADQTWSEPGMLPSQCSRCGHHEVKPVSAFLAKFLPSEQKDLQIEFSFLDKKVHNTRLFLMTADGHIEELEKAALAPGFLSPLSNRSAWRELIAQHLFADECVSMETETGYIIGCRPYADTSWSVHGLNLELERLIKAKEGEGFDLFTLLRESQELHLGLPHSDLYHSWLAGYAADISAGGVEPFVLIRSVDFVNVLAREAARLGLSTRRTGNDTDLRIRFSNSEFSVEVNLVKLVLRIVHGGLNFSEGIIEYFGRELSGIRAGAEAVTLIREALPELSVSVQRGTDMLIQDPAGKRLSSVNLIQFATEYDLRNEQQFVDGVSKLAPGHRPKSVTLSPHVAGQISSVVRRI